MKRTNRILVVAMAVALAACSRNPQPAPQQQMVNMCGFDQSGQQSCIMVPQNQTGQYYNNGYYSNNNGVYRDSGGHEVAAGLAGLAAGAAAGYMLNQHLNDRNKVPQQTSQTYVPPTQRARGPDGRFVSSNQQVQNPYVPAMPGNTVGKAPTGGVMAGTRDIQLTPATRPAAMQAPTPTFQPKSVQAPSFAPKNVAVPTPAFQPKSVAPVKPLNTFTPTSVKSTVPAKAQFVPKSVSSTKSTSSSSKSSFTPKSVKK